MVNHETATKPPSNSSVNRLLSTKEPITMKGGEKMYFRFIVRVRNQILEVIESNYLITGLNMLERYHSKFIEIDIFPQCNNI